MPEPKHEGFIYQIVIDGTTAICMTEEGDAKKFVDEKMKGAPFIILPVPIFSYRKEGAK